MANAIFSRLPTTVFEEMSGLARSLGAINLGQGFPDDPGPELLRAKAADLVLNGYNQYPPMAGLPELRQAVADHYNKTQGLDFEAAEITVTSGATEALAACFLGLIEPGDEAVVFQPFYDAYLPMIRRAGGVPKLVSLKPPHWRFDRAMLEQAFSPRTRLVVLNNPMNPTGVVLPDEDLALLAEFCVAHDVVAVCDEVWEQVVFEGARHRPLIAYPGMRERTVKIGSAGKIFSLTGWKVGFVMAAPPIMRVLAKAHQFLTFTTPPNLQEGAAFGLAKETAYFEGMRNGFSRSRDRLASGLTERGFRVLPAHATWFLNIDIAGLDVSDDVAFCRMLVTERGVAAIPVSAFYPRDPVRHVVRLCFAKADATLDAALDRLEGLASCRT